METKTGTRRFNIQPKRIGVVGKFEIMSPEEPQLPPPPSAEKLNSLAREPERIQCLALPNNRNRSRMPCAEQTARMLRQRYGDFAHYNRKNPFEELLFILCSIQTQESKYRKTYAALRRKFPRFAELAAATPSAIAGPLKFGGLSKTKSKLIARMCRLIVARFGKLSLAPLATMSDADCERLLTSLPGVGLKVARCVMMYSLDRQVFPVDTHCWRICRRLGWVRGNRDGVCTKSDMNRLQDKIPAQWRHSLHVNMVSLGREFCVSGSPRCEPCPLKPVCRMAQTKRSS